MFNHNFYSMKKRFLLLCTTLLISFSVYSQNRTLQECKFLVIFEKAYFYNLDKSAPVERYLKRKGYLVAGDVVWIPCKFSGGKFVYIEFKNNRGQVSKGWVRRDSLEEIDY